MKTITVANLKGGVGKSTISVHFAHALAAQGNKVLFVDLDSQANSSKSLTVFDSSLIASDLFADSATLDADMTDAIALISGDPALDKIDRDDIEVLNSFSENLSSFGSDFDFCVIDTPPTKGIRLHAALFSSDFALAPFVLDDYSLSGINNMIRLILGMKQRMNPDLVFLGVLANMVRAQSTQQMETLKSLIKTLPEYMLPVPVKLRGAVPVALSEGLPVWDVKGNASAREAGNELKRTFDFLIEKMKKEEVSNNG